MIDSGPHRSAASATKIFRQSALDRLSSPEQLDRMITLTRPAGWVALLAACALTLAALAWGIVGTIPTRVDGNGIFISTGGQVLDAVGPGSGILAALEVRIDTQVRRGEVIGRLQQTDTERSHRNAREVLAERQRDLSRRQAEMARERVLKERTFLEHESALRQVLAAAEQRNRYLNRSVASYEELASRGVITRARVEDMRKESSAVEQQIGQARADLIRIQADREDLSSLQERDRAQLESQVSDAQRQVDRFAGELEQSSQIRSPVDGRVTEIKVATGSVVSLGQPLVSIETAGDGLQVIAFVPPTKGKKVQAGMAVRIEPSTVRKEEFGTLIGTVSEISEFPATAPGMRSVLQNDQLVQQFSAEGPPYSARITLQRTADAPSGYRWSSGNGPEIRLASGTLAKVQVTVRVQPPISLVIPALRRLSGISP